MPAILAAEPLGKRIYLYRWLEIFDYGYRRRTKSQREREGEGEETQAATAFKLKHTYWLHSVVGYLFWVPCYCCNILPIK